MKIYTKKGDKGTTSLIGGQRVPKYDDKVEAYGTVDETNSYIGLIRETCQDPHTKETLLQIQNDLFVVESRIACADQASLSKMPAINPKHITLLENEIDSMTKALPPLRNFILPGGNVLAAHTHIARTICRRAERATLRAYKDDTADHTSLRYLNRLSDYLFTLARHFAHISYSGDIIWKEDKA